MLVRILKSVFLVAYLTLLALDGVASTPELLKSVSTTTNLNHSSSSSSSLNETFSFDYDFDVQRFLIRFVVEHFNHHTRVNLSSGQCLESWFRLRTNLIRSYYDSIRNKSSYWSLRGKTHVLEKGN